MRLWSAAIAAMLLNACALQREHLKRDLHFARYRMMSAPLKQRCGSDGPARWCLYETKDAAQQDPRSAIYFLHYATGDEKSLARLGLANALFRSYRRAGKPMPRLISVSYGTHWLFSDRPGRRQTVSTGKFLDDTLPALEKELGAPGSRYLWGMSQGGYNALELALARPELWRAAAISCPAVYAVDPFTTDPAAFAERVGVATSWAADGFDLFRTRLQDSAAWLAENPVDRARGQADPPPLLIQANAKDEFGFLEGARTLAAALLKRGERVELLEEPGSHCVNDAGRVADFFQSAR